VEWFLMTNEPVETAEAAYERVYYYTQRWKIERFHYVLKSGCTVEKLQERSMDKTTLLVLMYSVIAVMIMNLTYIARIAPEKPCTIFFEENEWKMLYCTANKNFCSAHPIRAASCAELRVRLHGPFGAGRKNLEDIMQRTSQKYITFYSRGKPRDIKPYWLRQ
jgi:hypothetical protein